MGIKSYILIAMKLNKTNIVSPKADKQYNANACLSALSFTRI